MGEGKPKYVLRPGDNTTRWLLMGAILRDPRRRLIHAQVAWPILEAWYDYNQNCRASVGFLAEATGITRGSVATASEDLVAWGYFTRIMGKGKAPTVYFPNWSIVLQPQDATSVLQPQDSRVLQPQDAKSASVLQPQDQPHLTSPLKGVLSYSVNDKTHAPLADGLAAVAAGARDPFEEFWTAYPRKYQKPKAKAAWAKLAPDAQLAERIIVAATSWSEHYAANPVEKKWMPAPANWLAGERYDEDLPDVYADPKEAAIAKAKDRPAKVDKRAKPPPAADSEPAPSEWVGDVSRLVPPGRAVTTISRATTTEGKGGQTVAWVFFDFEPEAGGTIIGDVSHHFYLEHPDEDRQKAGQRHLCALMNATGRHDVKAMEEFIGAKVVVTVGRDGSLRYSAANDNKSMREAA